MACSSQETQSHLSRVYGTLLAGIIFSAVGVYIHMLTQVSGTLTYIATLGMLIWLNVDSDKQNIPKVWHGCGRVIC